MRKSGAFCLATGNYLSGVLTSKFRCTLHSAIQITTLEREKNENDDNGGWKSIQFYLGRILQFFFANKKKIITTQMIIAIFDCGSYELDFGFCCLRQKRRMPDIYEYYEYMHIIMQLIIWIMMMMMMSICNHFGTNRRLMLYNDMSVFIMASTKKLQCSMLCQICNTRVHPQTHSYGICFWILLFVKSVYT